MIRQGGPSVSDRIDPLLRLGLVGDGLFKRQLQRRSHLSSFRFFITNIASALGDVICQIAPCGSSDGTNLIMPLLQ